MWGVFLMQAKSRHSISVKLNGQATEPELSSTIPPRSVQPQKTMGSKPASPLPERSEQREEPIPPEESALDRLFVIRQELQRESIKKRPVQESPAPAPLYPDQLLKEEGSRSDNQEAYFLGRGVSRTRRFGTKPGLHLLFSVAGAIALGLLFGFIVLSVFMQEQLSRSYHNVIDGTVQALTHELPGQEQKPAETGTGTFAAANGRTGTFAAANGGTGTIAAASGGKGAQQAPANSPSTALAGQPVAVHVPAQTLFMAQGGAFATSAAATEGAKPVEEKGFPHMIFETADKSYLFLAAATTRDQILSLATLLKSAGLDVYVKEVTFPAVQSEIHLNLPAEQSAETVKTQLNDFLQTGFDIARMLAEGAGGLTLNSHVAQAKDQDARLKELHRRFLEEGRTIQAIAPDAQKAAVNGMISGITQAVESYSQVKQANVDSHAWQVQKGVLGFMESYLQWSRQLH